MSQHTIQNSQDRIGSFTLLEFLETLTTTSDPSNTTIYVCRRSDPAHAKPVMMNTPDETSGHKSNTEVAASAKTIEKIVTAKYTHSKPKLRMTHLMGSDSQTPNFYPPVKTQFLRFKMIQLKVNLYFCPIWKAPHYIVSNHFLDQMNPFGSQISNCSLRNSKPISELQSSWQSRSQTRRICMQENHQAMKYFIKFQQLSTCIQWGKQHSADRLTMDSPNTSKMTWSTTRSQTPFLVFQKIVQAINAWYGMMWDVSHETHFWTSENNSKQKSNSSKSDKSLAKVFTVNKRNNNSSSTRARASTFQTEEFHYSDLSSNLGRQKAYSQEWQCCLTHTLLICGTLDTSPRTVQSPAWLLPKPKQPSLIRTSPCFWHRLEKRLSSLRLCMTQDCIESSCENSYSQCICSFKSWSLTFPWLLKLFRLLSLILCLFRPRISLLMAFYLSALTHWWNHNSIISQALDLKITYYQESITWLFMSLHWTELHDLLGYTGSLLQFLDWLGIGQQLFPAIIAAWIQERSSVKTLPSLAPLPNLLDSVLELPNHSAVSPWKPQE